MNEGCVEATLLDEAGNVLATEKIYTVLTIPAIIKRLVIKHQELDWNKIQFSISR